MPHISDEIGFAFLCGVIVGMLFVLGIAVFGIRDDADTYK